jgi:hypothetical protein
MNLKRGQILGATVAGACVLVTLLALKFGYHAAIDAGPIDGPWDNVS